MGAERILNNDLSNHYIIMCIPATEDRDDWLDYIHATSREKEELFPVPLKWRGLELRTYLIDSEHLCVPIIA